MVKTSNNSKPVDSKNILWDQEEIQITFSDGSCIKTSLVGGLLHSIKNQARILQIVKVLTTLLVIELGLIIWSLTLAWRAVHL